MISAALLSPLNGSLLVRAVGVERLDVGDEIIALGLVLHARKYHLGAGHQRLGALEPLMQVGVVPLEARLLQSVRISEAFDRSGRTVEDAVQLRTNLVLSARSNRMAWRALREDLLPSLGILRRSHGRQRQHYACCDNPLEHPVSLPVCDDDASLMARVSSDGDRECAKSFLNLD